MHHRRGTSCGLKPEGQIFITLQRLYIALVATKPYPGQGLGGGGGVKIHVLDTVRCWGLNDSCSRPMEGIRGLAPRPHSFWQA